MSITKKKPPTKKTPQNVSAPVGPAAAAPPLRLEWIDAATLQENPANWRRHPERQLDALKGSISEVGWAGALLLNEVTGKLIDGHARKKVAEGPVPVLVGSWTEEQEKKILATLDPLAAMATADKDALESLLRQVQTGDEAVAGLLAELAKNNGILPPEARDAPEAQIDRAGELQKKWGTERGQLWEIPSQSIPGKAHRLLCGDSTNAEDVARAAGDNEFEMVWTDPPYGVAVGDKNKFLNTIARSNRVEENLEGDTLDEAGISALLSQSFSVAAKLCRPGAAWYIAAPAGPLHVIFGQCLKDLGIWRQTIQWVKNNATFSPLGVDYHWRAEPIFYGWMPNAGHRFHGGRKQDTVWEIDRPQRSPEHPTMKPVALVTRAIMNSSLPGEVVCDPFVGSGTVLVAAESTGRLGVGCEIEPKYVAVALERLADMGLDPRLANG